MTRQIEVNHKIINIVNITVTTLIKYYQFKECLKLSDKKGVKSC